MPIYFDEQDLEQLFVVDRLGLNDMPQLMHLMFSMTR
jgi:hypothetical protein